VERLTVRAIVVAFLCFLSFLGSAVSLTAQQTHELKLTPANVHWGYYDSRVKPVLRIASGDTVRVETLTASGVARQKEAGASESEIPSFLREVEAAITERGPGAHPLTGPIYVEGAEPGDALEVRILNYEFIHPFGRVSFSAGGGTLPDEFPYDRIRLVRFDPAAGTAQFSSGVVLQLAPFFGSIGVAPARGRVSSSPPGPYTGNLDNKELVAGSILYLPVHVPGALLSMGDGHALQGDGEVTGSALETSLRGTVQVFLRKGKQLLWPRAETPTHFISIGLHTDLDEAARLATREMIQFLVDEKGMSRDEAYMLCSLAADLRVTQLVDGTKGIHAMLLKSIFQK
jgi:acetamidase/formamidase